MGRDRAAPGGQSAVTDQQHDLRTVFVRNIAFNVDDAELEEAFGDVGPVRSCFVVKQKCQTRHKGFGFVTYAIPEDAERAVEVLHGAELSGRKLKVSSVSSPWLLVGLCNVSI